MMRGRRTIAVSLAGALAVFLPISCVSERNGIIGLDGTECVVPGSAIGPGQAVVFIRNFAFFPDTLRVPAGTRVTWVNCETAAMEHTSTSNSGAWNSGLLSPGESFAHTFSAPGTNAYVCTPHPGMVGAIVVE